MSAPKEHGRPTSHSTREILDAIFSTLTEAEGLARDRSTAGPEQEDKAMHAIRPMPAPRQKRDDLSSSGR
jgi:hypothetical protein